MAVAVAALSVVGETPSRRRHRGFFQFFQNAACVRSALFWGVISLIFSTGRSQDFGYDGVIGPVHWGETFKQCIGKFQSPINIIEHNVIPVDLPTIKFVDFDKKAESAEIVNNGHTVMLKLYGGERPRLEGGPLAGEYEFEQLHFHWGANDNEGSETTINNSSFPMEMHLVFFRQSYGNISEATQHPDGLTVIAILFSSVAENNTNYTSILNHLPHVKEPDTKFTLTEPPSLYDLSGDHQFYYTYLGSLTTPPCSEVVTWIEFKSTIPISHDQLNVFRSMKSHHGNLVHNFRPTQPLHGRTIRTNRDTSAVLSGFHHAEPDDSDDSSSSNLLVTKSGILLMTIALSVLLVKS